MRIVRLVNKAETDDMILVFDDSFTSQQIVGFIRDHYQYYRLPNWHDTAAHVLVTYTRSYRATYSYDKTTGKFTRHYP